ncbi:MULTISPECIES: GNAT family N-acetyltransferase [unclassified Streptomyces]|uniref:GNAT family N-acetyltransferase n=1 Tax=unclassified Streptomyces TaxID=2593676 RepID=UPI0037FD4DB0
MPTPLIALPIRPLTTDDLAHCADLSEDRGWARDEHRWNFLLTASTGYGINDPEDPRGKRLAAACVLTSYGPRLAAVGMMLVAERHAGQGLGRHLMTHVLNEAGTTPLTLYATPHGRPLYQQLGFTDTGEAETVQGHFHPPRDTPENTTRAITTRAATAADLPAIIRLDTEAFGVDRTPTLMRLPAYADRLHVTEEGSALTGYAAASPSPTADVIGPLIAHDTPTAKALLSSLATQPGHPVRTNIDTRHRELLTWGKEHGLEPIARTTVMTHRIPAPPGDWTRRFAPLNLATS